MTKCDFCVKSMPGGKGLLCTVAYKDPHCEEAIKKMTEALKSSKLIEK